MFCLLGELLTSLPRLSEAALKEDTSGEMLLSQACREPEPAGEALEGKSG